MSETQTIFQLSVPSPNSGTQDCAICQPMLGNYLKFITDKNADIAKAITDFMKSLESGTPEYNNIVTGELRPQKESEEFVVPSYVYNVDSKVRIVFKDIKIKNFLIQELSKGYLVKYAQITRIGCISKYRKKKLLDISGATSNVIEVARSGCELTAFPQLAYKVSSYRFASDAKEDIASKEVPEQLIREIVDDLGIGSC